LYRVHPASGLHSGSSRIFGGTGNIRQDSNSADLLITGKRRLIRCYTSH